MESIVGMGVFASKPLGSIGGVTREQLLKSTENTRDFTNKLFQLMITKLTPEDFLKLGNPKTCNEYIFMMADSISQLFKDLRIRPTQKGDSGVVVFQKLDVLKKHQGESPESKYLCITISYFYIRIFQIFGSLAMTILDDPGAGQVLGMVRFGQPQLQKNPQRIVPGTRGPYTLFGGGPEERYFVGKAEPFRSLRELFESEVYQETVSRGWPRNVFTFKDMTEYDVNYIPDRTNESGRSQNIRVNLDNSKTNKLYANMTVERTIVSGLRVYKLIFTTFSLGSGTSVIDSDTLKKINSQLARFPPYSFELASNDDKRSWFVKGGKSFPDKFQEFLDTILKILDELYERPEDRIENLEVFQTIQGKKRDKSGEYRRDDIYDTDGMTSRRDRYPGIFGRPDAEQADLARRPSTTGSTNIGVPIGLQNEYIIRTLKSMAGYKSVGFCIARAFQLLDANTLFQSKPQQGISGVCRPVFDDLSSSVPTIGKRIDSVPGIKALDSLFYSTKGVDQKGSLDVRVANQAEYADFLKDLSSIFGKEGSNPPSRIDSILARDPNCASSAARQYLQIQDPASVAAILTHVNALFGKQLAHTTRVLDFFKQRLFLIVKSSSGGAPRVDIHPKLLQGGLAEIETVSKEARTILISYYKDCETIYRKGVDEVLRAKYIPVASDKAKR